MHIYTPYHRWSDLDLNIPDSYSQAYGKLTVIHAPILKSIRFDRPVHISKRDVKFRLVSCPRLERVSLSRFPMDGSFIQFENLAHLTLKFMSLIHTFRILRETPRMVFCQVIGTFSDLSEQRIGLPVLSSMRSLQLPLLESKFAQDFLDNLIAPHLEDLSLPKYDTPSIEVVTSFLRRSACSLRSLSISIVEQYFDGFSNLLQSMPSLSTVSITNLEYTEEYDPRNILQLVAKVLTSQNTSLQQGFLPNLQALEYTGKLHLHPKNYDSLYPLWLVSTVTLPS